MDFALEVSDAPGPTWAEESAWFWRQPRVGDAWVQHYWRSAEDPARAILLDVLATVAPFPTILEVGCHCGPLYRRLRERFGETFVYTGLDVNLQALGAALTLTRQVPGLAYWVLGSIVTPDTRWPAQSIDCVVVSSCFSLLPPEVLPMALAQVARLSARVIAIQEPADPRHAGVFHQWDHDYREALAHCEEAQRLTWVEKDGVHLGVAA